MARSADGHGSPARLFAKKKWSSSGETEARPTSRAARERIKSMQNLRAKSAPEGLRRWCEAGCCCHRPASSMARSADGHGSPARLFAKKKWSSSGETEARPTSRAARERIKSMQNLRARVAPEGLRRWCEAGCCCHRPASSMARSADGHGSPARLFAKKKWSSSGETEARPTSRAARERIKSMQNLRARVRTRGVTALVRGRVLLPSTR